VGKGDYRTDLDFLSSRHPKGFLTSSASKIKETVIVKNYGLPNLILAILANKRIIGGKGFRNWTKTTREEVHDTQRQRGLCQKALAGI
jgi:hypothetical protein